MVKIVYLHRYYTSQKYGGPEEGGWWYDADYPDPGWTPLEIVLRSTDTDYDKAYEVCRKWNSAEYDRREQECRHHYTSVLSDLDDFYTYDFTDSPTPVAFPQERPYYE